MQTSTPDQGIETYFEALHTGVKPVALKLRKIIKELRPQYQESIKWGKPCYGDDKNICYITAAKNHVNLGFYDASELQDPHKLLQGTGIKMRHLKFFAEKEVSKETIKSYLKQF